MSNEFLDPSPVGIMIGVAMREDGMKAPVLNVQHATGENTFFLTPAQLGPLEQQIAELRTELAAQLFTPPTPRLLVPGQ